MQPPNHPDQGEDDGAQGGEAGFGHVGSPAMNPWLFALLVLAIAAAGIVFMSYDLGIL